MLDNAPTLLRGAEETLVGDTVLIVAENVTHVRKELQQDVTEVGFRLVIGPLRQLLRNQRPHGLPDASCVSRHVVYDGPSVRLFKLRHLFCSPLCSKSPSEYPESLNVFHSEPQPA